MSEQPAQYPGAEADGSGAIVRGAAANSALVEVGGTVGRGLTGPEADSFGGGSALASFSRLLRAKWLILGVFVIISVATVPWIWLLTRPTYAATALVRVSPVVSRIIDPDKGGVVPLYWSYLNTEESIIASEGVLERVLDRAEIQATRWYKEPPRTRRSLLGNPPSEPLQRLTNALDVDSKPNTELIEVSLDTLVPRESAVIVNAVVDEYTSFSAERDRESENRRVETLREERQEVEERIKFYLATKPTYRNRDPEEFILQKTQRLGELEEEKQRLTMELGMTRSELARLASAAPRGAEADRVPDDPTGRHAKDAVWTRLSIALEGAREALAKGRQRYGEAHPIIKSLDERLDRAQGALRHREDQLDAGAAITPMPRTADGSDSSPTLDRAALVHRAQMLEEELDHVNQSIGALEKALREAHAIAKKSAQQEEDLRRAQARLQQLSDEIEEAEIESKAPGRISVAGHAVEPSQPSRDRRFLLTAMALGGALAIGLLIGHLRTVPQICEAGDVQHAVRAPFLGQLPALPAGKRTDNDSATALMEGIRMVRTALMERCSGIDHRMVLITSASSRSGKTSVAVELAKSLASLGKRTLLVEADLRRPALSEHLGIRPEFGLAALLSGATNGRQVIVPSTVPKLDLLLAGEQLADFRPEMLANGVFAGCIRQWKESYDFILLDSPPVLPVADARILAGQADGTVMVLRSSHSRRSDVVQAYADLSAAGGRLLGTVLVGVRPGATYGYSYGPPPENGASSETSLAVTSSS